MENINKIISLIIGLITVIVFFAVLTGRINLRNKLSGLTTRKVVTPTPTLKISTKIKITPTPTLAYKANLYQTGNTNITSPQSSQTPTTIPSTGLPVYFYSALILTFAGGIYLRRKK